MVIRKGYNVTLPNKCHFKMVYFNPTTMLKIFLRYMCQCWISVEHEA